MEKLDTNEVATEIYSLWLEIYRLWEESHESNDNLEKNSNKAINIFSRLLELIDKESDPHGYCVALRMRAQNYCLVNKCDEALKDLNRERNFNDNRNDKIRVKNCDELISQITLWCSGDNENINDSIQRFFVEKDSTNGL